MSQEVTTIHAGFSYAPDPRAPPSYTLNLGTPVGNSGKNRAREQGCSPTLPLTSFVSLMSQQFAFL